MNEIFKTNEFAIETVTTGSFLDEVETGKTYEVEVAVIRLNHIALREWQEARAHVGTEYYETQEEFARYLAEMADKQAAVEQKVKEALGWLDWKQASFTMPRNTGEIFTAIRMRKVEA